MSTLVLLSGRLVLVISVSPRSALMRNVFRPPADRLWLLRPGDSPEAAWSITSIDRESSGFEHASLLADLDQDGRDELYVASDDHGEVRRYLWRDDRFHRELLHKRAVPRSVFTWNLMPVPLEMLEQAAP